MPFKVPLETRKFPSVMNRRPDVTLRHANVPCDARFLANCVQRCVTGGDAKRSTP
jgi:hypothetical protein